MDANYLCLLACTLQWRKTIEGPLPNRHYGQLVHNVVKDALLTSQGYYKKVIADRDDYIQDLQEQLAGLGHAGDDGADQSAMGEKKSRWGIFRKKSTC